MKARALPDPRSPRTTWRLSPRCALAAGALFATVPAVAEDLAGAEDPPALERFPGAVIVAWRRADLRDYEFVTGRVERSRREHRVDRSVRVHANVLRVTYRTPAGTRLEDAVEHYRRAAAGFDEVFACRGRDCGRSTAWANDVFRVKELVAPDPAQFYLAAAGEDELVAVYVAQRGNRRVYAHVEFASGNGIGALARGESKPRPVQDANGAVSGGIANALLRHRFAIVPNVVPDDAGGLDRAAQEALDAVAAEVAALGRKVHVVCHLGGLDGLDGKQDAEAAVEQSAHCAKAAALRLRAGGVDAAPFGAGPLLPRPGVPRARVELVVP